MKIKIVMKSGYQFSIGVKSFTSTRSSITGELVSIKWELYENSRIDINYIDANEVALIIREN